MNPIEAIYKARSKAHHPTGSFSDHTSYMLACTQAEGTRVRIKPGHDQNAAEVHVIDEVRDIDNQLEARCGSLLIPLPWLEVVADPVLIFGAQMQDLTDGCAVGTVVRGHGSNKTGTNRWVRSSLGWHYNNNPSPDGGFLAHLLYEVVS